MALEKKELEEQDPPEEKELDDEGTLEEIIDDRDYDTEASRMGWADEESWKGDPEQWVDAKTFVKRGDEFLPYLKADRNRLLSEVQKLNQKMSDRDKRFEQYQEHQKSLLDIEKKRKDAALLSLKEQKKAAIDDNDGELVVALEDQMKAIEEITIPEIKEEPVEENPKEHPDFVTWRSDNDWYVNDPVLETYANGVAGRLMERGTTLKGRAFLDEVTKTVKQEMAHKFTNPKRKKPGTVAPNRTQPQNKKKGFADLPAEAKQACEGFVEEGLYANTPEGRDEYAAEYFEVSGEE